MMIPLPILSLGFFFIVNAPAEDKYFGRPLNFWIEQLERGDEFHRREAAKVLARIGPSSAPAVPALIQALQDRALDRKPEKTPVSGTGQPEERLGARPANLAAEALGNIGRAAVPELIKGLECDDISTRWGSAEALAIIGPEAGPAVPALIGVLTRRNDWSRHLAANALGRIGPGAAPAVPALITSLKQGDKWAAEVLGMIGPAAKTALPTLIEFAGPELERSDKLTDAEGPTLARVAIWRIGPEAVPVLTDALTNHRRGVRRGAAAVLRLFGPEADAALPALIVALRDEDDEVRTVAAETLGTYVTVAEHVVPPLVELLKDQHFLVRRAALQALARLGPRAHAAVPAITDTLEDPNISVRRAAVQALTKIDPKALPDSRMP